MDRNHLFYTQNPGGGNGLFGRKSSCDITNRFDSGWYAGYPVDRKKHSIKGAKAFGKFPPVAMPACIATVEYLVVSVADYPAYLFITDPVNGGYSGDG